MLGLGTKVFKVVYSEKRDAEYRPVNPCNHCGLPEKYALWERFYPYYMVVEFVILCKVSNNEYIVCDPEDYDKIITNEELYEYFHLVKTSLNYIFLSAKAAQDQVDYQNRNVDKGEWIRFDNSQDND